MQEIYYSGDAARQSFAYENQPKELYDLLLQSFPWVDPLEYFSISEPTYHDILEEDVITCCLPRYTSTLLVGPQAALTARKFCMTSKTSYLRSYELYEQSKLTWLPDSAKLFFYGVNHEELFRPFNPKVNTFTDFYFSGDPNIIEQAFNLPEKRGKYDTGYGATVVDNKVVRVKQYCYDEQTTFSEWDLSYIIHCKNIGRTDLL